MSLRGASAARQSQGLRLLRGVYSERSGRARKDDTNIPPNSLYTESRPSGCLLKTRFSSSASLPSPGTGVKGRWNPPYRHQLLPNYQHRFARCSIKAIRTPIWFYIIQLVLYYPAGMKETGKIQPPLSRRPAHSQTHETVAAERLPQR